MDFSLVLLTKLLLTDRECDMFADPEGISSGNKKWTSRKSSSFEKKNSQPAIGFPQEPSTTGCVWAYRAPK